METTLSSKASLALIEKAHSYGYEIHLIFVALSTPERCIARVRSRALRGGHFIPDVDVRRRYNRSIANLVIAARRADIAKVYDNSGERHRLLLTVKGGVVINRPTDLPSWIQPVVDLDRMP